MAAMFHNPQTNLPEDVNSITPATMQDTDLEYAAATSMWRPIAQKELANSPAAYSSPSGSIVISFASPHAYRLQIRVRSCDVWFPRTRLAGLEPAYDYMSRMMPYSPALAVAADASSLCCLGQHVGDERLVKGGQLLHMKALNLLRRELDNPRDRQNKALAAAILTIQVHQSLTSMEYCGTSWLQHSQGLSTILANLPEEADHEGSYGYKQMLLASFYRFDFWAGLVNRRPIRCLGSSAMGPELASIAERIPGVLSEVDAICSPRPSMSLEDAVDAIDILTAIETELNAWIASWNSCIRTSPFSVVATSKMLGYHSPSEPLRNPFTLCMTFQTFGDALDHCVSVAGLLAVRRAMIDICRTVSSTWKHVHQTFEEKIRALVVAATTCADSLCMSLTYFFEPDLSKYGLAMTVGPLREATSWYRYLESTGSTASVRDKLQWGEQTALHIRKAGIRTR